MGEITEVMRRIRKRRKLTQVELSEALGVHDTYWHMYEAGKRRPSLTLIARMRAKIDLTDDEVLDLVAAAVHDEGVEDEEVAEKPLTERDIRAHYAAHAVIAARDRALRAGGRRNPPPQRPDHGRRGLGRGQRGRK